MAEAILLGTASALPSPEQENTHLILRGEHHLVLIDCAGSPYRRLQQAGLDPGTLDGLIVTHFHPDHVYGVPSLLLSLWMIGRRQPLDIYGSSVALELLQRMLAPFGFEGWPAMSEVRYHAFPLLIGAPVLANHDFEIMAAPVRHMVPTCGLRVLNRLSGRVLAYSSDTEPCEGVRWLARDADTLIHEAAGARKGHSSAAQAGALAQEMGVRQLVLVHYDAQRTAPEALEAEAKAVFTGLVCAARDLQRFAW